MSVDYSLFLRDQPDLAAFEDDFDLEPDDGDYLFAGFRIWVKPFAGHHVIDKSPWVGEIKWVVAANGRHNDDTFDDFLSLMEAIGERYRGAIWCDHGDDLEWYWWDREQLAAKAQSWRFEDFMQWIGWARGDDGLPQTGGVMRQLAELVLGRLASFPLNQQQMLLAGIWLANQQLGGEVREVVGDALLEIDASGNKGLLEVQKELEQERSVEADRKQPLPQTREALAELYDRALSDPSAHRILQRGLETYGGDDFMRAEFGAVLLERARAGAAKPSWMWSLESWPQFGTAPERDDRAAFAKLGSLAALIVKHWNDGDAYAAQLNDLLERRRRAGEIYAGIPDDIRALATSGKHDEAYKAYSQRYGLSLEKAKQVVDANA